MSKGEGNSAGWQLAVDDVPYRGRMAIVISEHHLYLLDHRRVIHNVVTECGVLARCHPGVCYAPQTSLGRA